MRKKGKDEEKKAAPQPPIFFTMKGKEKRWCWWGKKSEDRKNVVKEEVDVEVGKVGGWTKKGLAWLELEEQLRTSQPQLTLLHFMKLYINLMMKLLRINCNIEVHLLET